VHGRLLPRHSSHYGVGVWPPPDVLSSINRNKFRRVRRVLLQICVWRIVERVSGGQQRITDIPVGVEVRHAMRDQITCIINTLPGYWRMSWLKRFHDKRRKSDKDSLDGVYAHPEPEPTPPVPIDLQGKKPAIAAARTEQVCVLISYESAVKFQLTLRTLALVQG
jgi:hypothetical protein